MKEIRLHIVGCKGISGGHAVEPPIAYDEAGCLELWVDGAASFAASVYKGFEINLSYASEPAALVESAWAFSVQVLDEEMSGRVQAAEARWLDRQLEGIRLELLEEGGFDRFIIGV